MKRYRSKIKGPLPIGLRSGSISVASRGYFSVDGDDLNSPDLLTKIRLKQVELKEETVVREVKSEPPPPPESISEPELMVIPEVEPEEAPSVEPEESIDVMEDEKGDDSLTSSLEMVESKDEETNSDDANLAGEPTRTKKKRKATSGRKRNKR